MSEKNNRSKGIVGTIGFHLLALLALLYFALSTPLPLPGEEGVEVNLGSSDQGMGQAQELSPPPLEQPPPSLPPPQTDPEPEPEEEIITQDFEETPAIEKEVIEKKDEEKQEKEVITPDENPVEEVVEEVIEKDPEPVPEPPKVDKRALYKGKSETDGDGSNQGETGQAGDQGKPDGTPGSSNYTGFGKGNDGTGWELTGRGVKNLTKPEYNSNEVGKVNVEILVDREGNVVRAVAIDKKSTTTDTYLRRQAEKAAMHSKFTSDPNANETQKGYIIYTFIRIN